MTKTSEYNNNRGHCGRDHMVVGFTTTYAINAFHHWCCEFESRSGWGVQVQHYIFCMWYSLSVTCDRSVVFSGSSTNKTDRHDITEILLKVVLNTIKQTNKQYNNNINNNKYIIFVCTMIQVDLNEALSFLAIIT